MKIALVLMLCAIVAAAPKVENHKVEVVNNADLLSTVLEDVTPEQRNILVNALVRQLIAFLRYIINNGSSIFGIPVLDPFELESYHLYLPAGIINLDMILKDAVATGFGGFVMHKSDLNLRDLTFDVDFTFPKLDLSSEHYDLTGNLLHAIPLFGNGKAEFEIEEFRIKALLFLKQSEDGNSVLIDRIANAAFEMPNFKSRVVGVIGGGDIDAIFNAMIEDVVIDYVNRFQGAIAALVSRGITVFANPFLDRLDTWRFIAPLLPR